MRFRDVRFRSKLLLLIGLSVVGFVTVFVVGAVTLARVQVTEKTYGDDRISGNLYQEIVITKDMVADILPPPEYVVESYLVLHQVHMLTEPDKIQERARTSRPARPSSKIDKSSGTKNSPKTAHCDR